MICCRHRHCTGRSDKTRRAFNGITDCRRLGAASPLDRIDKNAQGVMSIATEGLDRLSGRLLISLLVGDDHGALRVAFRKQPGDKQRRAR